MDNMSENKKSVVIIGLGYVGLPLALEFSQHYCVTGFDVNSERIDDLNDFRDTTQEVSSRALKSALTSQNITFVNDETKIVGKDFYVVAVPTPVNSRFEPDLTIVEKASVLLGRVIASGSIVIFESTVYPGVTEDICIPLINKGSGLEGGVDFFYGYSPERINPGDLTSSVTTVVKVTSGCCSKSADLINELYSSIVKAGVYSAKSIKVAEAAKVFENIQRDVNIALVNEFSILCTAMGIKTSDVLDAADTKWNFMRFSPGLVGGHCIGIDPYYLIHKAKSMGHSLDIAVQARKRNESMPYYIVEQLKNKLIQMRRPINDINVLVLGYTFKENCPDIRNTKVMDIIVNLNEFTSSVAVFDPWVAESDKKHSKVNFIQDPRNQVFDAVIIAVKHQDFVEYSKNDWDEILRGNPIVFDLKESCHNVNSHFSL